MATDPAIANVGGLTSQPLAKESSLSSYIGPYVTEMLGRGAGIASEPYQAYMGPLTAGTSDLQDKGFQGLAGLNIPTDQMGSFTPQTFTGGIATQYMNPFLDAALAPQIAEARRQSDISALADRSRLTKAGAFGGGRQAIIDAERDRNLQQNLSAITGKGYSDAFSQAMKQFNVEQDRSRGVQEDVNKYGLAALGDQLDAGAIQRGIESEGVLADREQFIEERDFPYKQVQYMQSLLQGLPLATQSVTYAQPTFLEQLRADSGDTMALLASIFGTGDKPNPSSNAADFIEKVIS